MTELNTHQNIWREPMQLSLTQLLLYKCKKLLQILNSLYKYGVMLLHFFNSQRTPKIISPENGLDLQSLENTQKSMGNRNYSSHNLQPIINFLLP